ncbi:hypothetical protein PAXRUDRAFT_824402, partial [Paxillus rubicundulus Ve08.2h10]
MFTIYRRKQGAKEWPATRVEMERASRVSGPIHCGLIDGISQGFVDLYTTKLTVAQEVEKAEKQSKVVPEAG